jgi:hypothetical protein
LCDYISETYILFHPGFIHMRESKPSVVTPSVQHLSLVHKANTDQHLRRKLQEEIDRLAMLIQEVNRQSAKVQAAADAIGDRTLLSVAP